MTKFPTNAAPRIDTLGIDIAKNVLQLHAVDRRGRVVLQRRVMRDQLLPGLVADRAVHPRR